MQRLIIDTDPGEDDALAIMMAAAHPGTKIEALTVVAGNVGLKNTTNNAAVILDQLGLDIPIYPGCKTPFVMPGIDAAYAHGLDGLGNTGLRSNRPVQAQHAALALIDHVNASPGDLSLVALGPLTNIATALKLDPELPRKLRRTIIMGGAVSAHGNVNYNAEFNIYADPEAAFAFFHGWGAVGCLVEVADWELTMRHGFSTELRAEWAGLGTPKASFFAAISAHSNEFIQKVRRRTVQYFADPVAMAVALEPAIVVSHERHHLTVSLADPQTRGQTIVDWSDHGDQPVNADIILKLDHDRLLELIRQAQL
ncbi:MAG: nucleoside hydrolase [Anaerolineales bacterium]|nr:nucleoside hydrolase [Anaerolineales bacterium]